MAIPKNLVYVFVLIILFAFLAMCYITYFERGVSDFLAYDRTKEVVVIDHVFSSLQSSMDLAKGKVPEETVEDLTPMKMNTKYLVKNKPVKVVGWGKNWPSLKKWK